MELFRINQNGGKCVDQLKANYHLRFVEQTMLIQLANDEVNRPPGYLQYNALANWQLYRYPLMWMFRSVIAQSYADFLRNQIISELVSQSRHCYADLWQENKSKTRTANRCVRKLNFLIF